MISEKKKQYNRKYYAANQKRLLEYRKKYVADNREEINRIALEKHWANRDKILQKNKKNYLINREKILEYNRKWHHENRDKIYEMNKKYAKENPEKVKEWSKKSNLKLRKYHIQYLKKWKKAHPLVSIAGDRIKYAIKVGKIKRIPCEFCGNPKSEAHHEDYTKPLDVWFLCKKHHTARHLFLREVR